MTQLDLESWAERHHPNGHSVYDDAPEVDRRSLKTKFEEFDRNNPHVYAELVKLAKRARARGVERLGIKMLYERLRWELQVETYHPGADKFRLNNNYHALYARKMMDEYPELRDLFETRESPSKHGDDDD